MKWWLKMMLLNCMNEKTKYQEKTGNNPDPCKVPIINLKTREIKIMKFGE